MTLIDKIKKFRKETGMSQRQFADKVGVSKWSISNWEKGNIDPRPDHVKTIEAVIAGTYIPPEEKEKAPEQFVAGPPKKNPLKRKPAIKSAEPKKKTAPKPKKKIVPLKKSTEKLGVTIADGENNIPEVIDMLERQIEANDAKWQEYDDRQGDLANQNSTFTRTIDELNALIGE